MKRVNVAMAALPAFLLAGCASDPSAEQQAAMADKARNAVDSFSNELGGELMKSLEANGPEASINVCKDKAPAIAHLLSRSSGFTITRVSSKNRNPKDVPDAWEAEALAALEKRLAGGESPKTLETWGVVKTASGKEFRYAKALVTRPLCLMCHGEDIDETIKAELDKEYPNDKATGYGPDTVRGIVSIRRPL